jgi:hypothetical protein
MNILMTGRGTSGSWQIRGVQLGAAIGATVAADALDCAPYDAAILIKRPSTGLVDRLHKADVPIVYDVVDAWPQPYGNEWNKEACLHWLTQQIRAIRPAAIVAATNAMARDCEQFGLPVLWLPHHCRPAQRVNPIRGAVKVVGYQGGANYLGKWRRILEQLCERRGWRFVVDPEQLADLDIVLALRDAPGYAAWAWKSNVKLSNAQGTGTPFIGRREDGYLETSCGAEFWADDINELEDAFDALTPYEARVAISQKLLTAARTLDDTAKVYKQWLSALKF